MNEEQKLFEEMSRVASSMKVSPEVVLGASINLLVNAIRQVAADRETASSLFFRMMANTKKILLDVHYDPATGQRRNVFPFTQVVQAPFHEEKNDIWPPRC